MRVVLALVLLVLVGFGVWLVSGSEVAPPQDVANRPVPDLYEMGATIVAAEKGIEAERSAMDHQKRP